MVNLTFWRATCSTGSGHPITPPSVRNVRWSSMHPRQQQTPRQPVSVETETDRLSAQAETDRLGQVVPQENGVGQFDESP